MTTFTPECLARTDFPRLVRNNPSSARERLTALIADPEALDLYGENLSSKGFADRGFIDQSGWDELRHRILREGLSHSTLDNETLARLALDFDALAELQFDLFSTETPQEPWQSLLAPEAVGRECSEIYCGEQTDDPVDIRIVWTEAAERPSKLNNTRIENQGEVGPDLTTAPRPCFYHRMPPSAPRSGIDTVLGGEGLCVFSEARLDFQRCLVARRGWLYWPNHLIDHPTSGSGVMFSVHCDTRTKPVKTSLCEDHEWDTFALISVHLVGSPSLPESWTHTLKSRRHRHECRDQLSSWLRCCEEHMALVCSWNKSFQEMKHDALAEHIALLNGSFSTFDRLWTREWANSVVALINAAIPVANDIVVQRTEPDAATGLEARAERYRGPSRYPDGRLIQRQLPAPTSSGSRRELASTI